MKKLAALLVSLLLLCSCITASAENPFAQYQATLTKATGVSTIEEWIAYPETRALLTMLTATDIANTLAQSDVSIAFDMAGPSYVCISNSGPLLILLSTQNQLLFQVYYFPNSSTGDYMAYDYSFYTNAESYADAVAKFASTTGKDVYENSPEVMTQIMQMLTGSNQ